MWITWGIFYINKSNKLISKSSYTQPELPPQPSTSLQGNQIRMYDLDTDHRQFSITHEDKFQDQWTLIRLIIKNKLTTNGAKIKTKTPKDTIFKWNLLRKLTHRSNVFEELLNSNHLKTITGELKKNNKLKRLFQ